MEKGRLVMASTATLLHSTTEPTALDEAEEAARKLSDDELRLFGAWLARYASDRLARPVSFSFRPLTDEEVAYGERLAEELNAKTA